MGNEATNGGSQQGVAVVIGATKGIGLALCQLLQAKGFKVIATVRTASAELKSTGAEVVEGVDVTQEGSCKAVQQALKGQNIRMLVVAAGCQEVDTFKTITKEGIRKQFEVNALGPLFAVKELEGCLPAGGKVLLLSSKNASIAEMAATGGELYGYRMSKAALNMAGAVLARDLQPKQISVALIHPGVVNTEMLRSLRSARGVPKDKLTANTITPEHSAARIWELTERLNLENSGSFWAADSGAEVAW